jgi:hypothetical protein
MKDGFYPVPHASDVWGTLGLIISVKDMPLQPQSKYSKFNLLN